MPEKKTLERARRDKREGKSASTQAGEFVREEMEHIREGKHGARSAKQAIAIGLSKARRAGVKLAPPEPGEASPQVRRKAKQDLEAGAEGAAAKPAAKRSRAVKKALKKEPRRAASKTALARQAKKAASERSPGERSAAAKKAARTKGAAARSAAAKKAARSKGKSGRSAAAKKAARTRAANASR